MKHLLTLGCTLNLAACLVSPAPYLRNDSRPIILAHRGAMGLFPEHTIGSYSSAYFSGVDFVELDVQITKDGHLVCSHDPTLKETTDVEKHPEYADRMVNVSFPLPYEYTYKNDFLIHDFTLAEIKSLKKIQRYEKRNQMLNGMFEMVTLEEAIELLLKMNKEHPRTGRSYPVGLYIETKMYNFYKAKGLDSAELVIGTLEKYGLDSVDKAKDKLPIILECFEKESLQHMNSLGNDLPRIYLTNQNIVELTAQLPSIANYAHGIGPRAKLIFDLSGALMKEAQKLKLEVHPWYVRDDFLEFTESPQDENMLFFHSKVNGIFTEFPHMTYAVYDKAVRDKEPYSTIEEYQGDSELKFFN